MKAAFVVNARNKARWVARAVQGALSQNHPCHIILSDQNSIDGTFEVMQKTVEEFKMPVIEVHDGENKTQTPFHKVDLLKCPVEGEYGMRAANEHFMWCVEQTDAEWIFQCSADDYSLPGRVLSCMKAVSEHPCAAVSCGMYFVEPGQEHSDRSPRTGWPTTDDYVAPGEGMMRMAYGSSITGFKRSFLEKIGSAGDNTMDVYDGFLAACDEGHYVVTKPSHVHVMHSDLGNMGFQGKMRAAEAEGDRAQMTRINELNRFQLFKLYFSILETASRLYPMLGAQDKALLLQMVLNQAHGWMIERDKLHADKITPGIM